MTLNNIFNKKFIIFIILITLKIRRNTAQNEYIDDQGRYVFDAPPSIRNKQRVTINPNSIVDGNSQPNNGMLSINDIIASSQQSQNQQQQQQLQQQSLQSATVQSTTTPKPRHPKLKIEIRNCVRLCPTTSEFNPVCGNDRITYPNLQKLLCAKTCGQDVHVVRHGRCVRFAPIQY